MNRYEYATQQGEKKADLVYLNGETTRPAAVGERRRRKGEGVAFGNNV